MKCINCQKETDNPKFCSRTCSSAFNGKMFPKRKITRQCRAENCKSLVKDCRSYFCQEHFDLSNMQKKEKLLNSTVGEYRDKIKESGMHVSSVNVSIRGFARSWFKDLTKKPCAYCGYKKHVELCHIKAISSFSDATLIKEINNKENIIQLCPNCHWEFDNLKKNGEEDGT